MTNRFRLRGRLAAAPSTRRLHPPRIAQAARLLLPDLERGRRIDAGVLRAAMETAFGASDADGAWDWKTAYDACEAATVLFLRKFGPAHARARPASPAAHAPDAGEDRGPAAHPHAPLRGERAAPAILDADRARLRGDAPRPRITPADRVLEPSAGTGLLAILAELAGGVARPERTRRDPRRTCSIISSPASPSPASTPRRSTIISTPASRRASC